MGNPEGKRPLGRYKHRREVNISMDLREIKLGCMDWIQLAQDRDYWSSHVNAVLSTQRLAASQEGLNSMPLVS
jgi:hypothetical protein